VKLLASRELPCETTNPDALTQALIQLRRALPVTAPAVLGMPSTASILTTIVPLIPNPRRAGLAVQFELQQHLPFELTDATWHYHWLPGENGRHKGMRTASTLRTPNSAAAVVAAIKRSLLDERLACCRRAGLSIRAVAINPVATLNAWDTQAVGAVSAPVVLLNLLNDPTAEWIIRTATQLSVMPVASALPQTPTPESAAASETFLQELSASWNALQQQCGHLPQKIWLIGSAAAMPRLSEAVAAKLQLEVEEIRLTRAVSVNATIAHLERWTVAIGLGLQGLGMAPISLNLLDRMQSEGHVRTVQRVAALTSALFTVIALGFALSGMMEVRSRRAFILQALEKEERLYQTLRPKAQALLRHQQRIQERSDQLQQLAADRVVLTRLLSQAAAALPESVWLTKLDYTKNGVVEGMLEGRATSFQDVTQFFDRLKTVAGMTNIKPLATNVITDQSTGKELIAFSVQMQRQATQPPALAAAADAEAPVTPAGPPRKGAKRP
jgi:Tfp pilus assembly protein PilN/Tfp pilus assembly PilM family ATPase